MGPQGLAESGLERLDKLPLDLHKDDILCFVCARDEALRLPYFLDYHRKLGIGRFFVVDNASTDGTRKFLLGQNDVHVFAAAGSYAASNCGVVWMNGLLSRFGPGHWTLTVDADELLVYPHCETLPLPSLTAYLYSRGWDGLKSFLLDMYADRPICQTVYRRGTPFLESCSYFDWNTYHLVGPDGIPVRGGPRHRLFWEGRVRPNLSPVLHKTPLVRWRDGLSYEASTHRISGLTSASVTGVLLHFKFFSDFVSTVIREVGRKEHWDAALQYASYLDVLKENPEMSAYCAESKRYSGSLQLVELGLLQMPADFASLAGPMAHPAGMADVRPPQSE